MPIESINPASGEKIRVYKELAQADAVRCAEKAHQAFQSWKQLPLEKRGNLVRAAAERLRKDQEKFAGLMTLEMGKPIVQARAEIEKCAWVCDYYAENAAKFLSPEPVKTDASQSYVTFKPLGILLAVMPWNFPFWQVFRAAVPALMAGNVVLLKHAPNVPGCAEAIEKVFVESGFPPGVYTNLFVEASRIAELIEHPHVKAVTLTGSVAAGKAVAGKAGAFLKKAVLELGGSDPYLVLEDAPLDETANTCSSARLINSGQSCIAAKRFIVLEKIYDSFVQKILQNLQKQKMGDPMDESVGIGPMARRDLRDKIHKQVSDSVARGARLLLGGKIPEGRGFYYPPTLLTEVKKGMPAYDEEIFGPVAAVIKVKNVEEAVQAANDTVFGLGGAVFTENKSLGEKIAAEEINAGCVFVNASVKSHPALPFGGINESGYGRELGIFGIREFVNIKTVYIR